MPRPRKRIELVDSPVVFNAIQHSYKIVDGPTLSGITSMLSRMLFADKYKGISEDVLAAAAQRGSNIHEEISMYESAGIEPSTKEGQNYVKIIKPQLDIIQSEYLVSDNEHFASSIDLVGRDKKDIMLYDIKTTKSGLDKEYVRWQLSCYAYLFELQNPILKVKGLAGLWLSEDNADIVPVDRIDSDIIKNLFTADVYGLPFSNPFAPSVIEETAEMIQWIDFETKYNQLEAELKALKELKDKAMIAIEQVIDSIDGDTVETEHLKFTKVKPTTKVTIDSKKLKLEHPDIYDECSKVSSVKGYIKTSLKK